jgi:hypothetical protein
MGKLASTRSMHRSRHTTDGQGPRRARTCRCARPSRAAARGDADQACMKWPAGTRGCSRGAAAGTDCHHACRNLGPDRAGRSGPLDHDRALHTCSCGAWRVPRLVRNWPPRVRGMRSGTRSARSSWPTCTRVATPGAYKHAHADRDAPARGRVDRPCAIDFGSARALFKSLRLKVSRNAVPRLRGPMVKSASTKALAPWMAEFVGTPACLEGIDAMHAGRMMRRALERSRVCTPRARARARVRAGARRGGRARIRGREAGARRMRGRLQGAPPPTMREARRLLRAVREGWPLRIALRLPRVDLIGRDGRRVTSACGRSRARGGRLMAGVAQGQS